MTSSGHAGALVGPGRRNGQESGCPAVWLQGPNCFISFAASDFLEMRLDSLRTVM